MNDVESDTIRHGSSSFWLGLNAISGVSGTRYWCGTTLQRGA